MTTIATDYLVVGAGASGMAFADELVSRADVEVVLVDRQDAPGGHWNHAYPFVRLHQASANYGCNSRPLGTDAVEVTGPNAGFYERATGPEVCAHFRDVLEDLVATGRVRFLSMSDYVGDRRTGHVVTSRLTGASTAVTVRRRVVDATYLDVAVPATHARSFTADPDAHLIPVGGLVELAAPPAGVTVLGAGKTAMDACLWLLGHGIDPDRIRWVRSRDVWMLDRSCVQPLDQLPATMQSWASWVEATAEAGSAGELFERLEACGELSRLDQTVQPGVFRGPILTRAEMAALRAITDVVRLGRVRHIGADRLLLTGGDARSRRGELYVDATASGFRWKPPVPMFEPGRITLQSLIGGFTTCYAALVGYVEAARDDDVERNRLCPPTPQITHPIDWVGMIRGALRSGALHAAEPDLVEWNDTRRLSLTRGLSTRLDDPQLADALNRWAEAAEPAAKNAETLLAAAGYPA